MRKLTAPPGAETVGMMLHSFSENLQGEFTAPIMSKHGFDDIEPQKWYPVQMLFDALNEISAMEGSMFNMTAIGMKVGAGVPVPPELGEPTLEKVVMIWNDLYQMLHRGADLGCIRARKINDKHLITIHSDPYPDDMSYGILYAYARRFLPKGTHFTVRFDTEVLARDHGGTGDITIIHVEWT